MRKAILIGAVIVCSSILTGCSRNYPDSFGGKLFYGDTEMTLSWSSLRGGVYEGNYGTVDEDGWTWEGRYTFTPGNSGGGTLKVTLTKSLGADIGAQPGGVFDVIIQDGKIVRMTNEYDSNEVWTIER